MKHVIHPDFLLTNSISRELYHGIASKRPIIDYHCHLNASDMATDRRFENLAELWVQSDPYKHRVMRILGVKEAEITGEADAWTKFKRWAESVPQLLGSPSYDWAALELYRYFGIDEPLNAKSASDTWESVNSQLSPPKNHYRGLLSRYPVEAVHTSNCLLEDLSHHATIQQCKDRSSTWFPSLRADEIVAVERANYLDWVKSLSESTGIRIDNLESLKAAILQRLDVFNAMGCKLADHSLDSFDYVTGSMARAETLLKNILLGGQLQAREANELRPALLSWLAGEYSQRGWVLQLHLGALRHTSSRLRSLAGSAGGYAGMGNPIDLSGLCAWLAELEHTGQLPRVILYTLNPALNAAMATLTGSYAEDGITGKLQFGPAWWWNDHRLGMRAHLGELASYGVLSTFIGMTTDSRSVLSFVRHEYYRRVLCEWLGDEVTSGRMPDDPSVLRPLLAKLCDENARNILV